MTTGFVRMASACFFGQAQRTKRHECDVSGHALVEDWIRGPIREIVGVLHTDDVGDFKCPQELSMGDVADADPGDQAVVPRGYQGAELVDKPFVGYVGVQHAQVYGGELLDTERRKILFDTRAELIGVVVGQYRAEFVSARANLTDQCQSIGVGRQCFPDQLIHHSGPVILRGVNVIDTCIDGCAQHRDRLVAIPGRTEDTLAGQLHRAIPDAPDHFVGQAVAATRR
jgi:hypothetical protein